METIAVSAQQPDLELQMMALGDAGPLARLAGGPVGVAAPNLGLLVGVAVVGFSVVAALAALHAG